MHANVESPKCGDVSKVGVPQVALPNQERACDVSVIIPTYLEAENLPALVSRLATALADAQLTGEILIVDDDSPDDTVQVCAELTQAYPVRLVVRTNQRGLAGAVVRGLQEARGNILVVMDADLSHPPEKVPTLYHVLQNGSADFVIGSRYMPGGCTDESWSFFRRLNSKLATWLARPLTAVHDPMAGFFALRRSTFDRTAARLNPVGYKIGLELMVKGDCRNIVEIPIHFSERKYGQSKLNFREQLNYLRHLTRLYRHRLWSSG